MLSKVKSFSLIGLKGVEIDVEVDIMNGKPQTIVVGLPDSTIKESIERVSSAISNSGFFMPQKKIVINLAPADVKKEGSLFDLPIAVGILESGGYLENKVTDFAMIGELSLDGKLRAVNGMLPLLISAREMGYNKIIIPSGNVAEASYIEDMEVYAFDDLKTVINFLTYSNTDPANLNAFEPIFISPSLL